MGEAQQRMRTVLEEIVASGREDGLQLAVYLDGHLVIDACAGEADSRSGRRVDSGTLFSLFSCGKGLTAAAAHLLVERGVLDYDTPLAAYWPEFAVHGKDRVTLRHALTHAAGIPHLPAATTLGEVCDWHRTCEIVAGLTPCWEPGSRSEYHPVVYGWLVGETVRRADGRRIDQVVREEITRPLGVEDELSIGLPAALLPRIAHHTDGAASPRPAPAPLDAPVATLSAADQANHPARQRACVPSSCLGSARGLARMYAALAAGGTLDGVRVLPPERVARAVAPAVETPDPHGDPVPRGLGYLLGAPGNPLGEPHVFGHDGMGGSVGFADPRNRFAFALAKTRLTEDWSPNSTANQVAREVRAALGLTGR